MGEIMTDPATSKKNPWYTIHTFLSRKLTILQIIANLAGAGTVTSYFMFFDPNLKVQRVTNDLIVIGIMFVGLVLIATFFLNHWMKDLMHFVNLKIQQQDVDPNLRKRVQRKILDLPYKCSLTSLFNWFLAACIMTVYFPIGLSAGSQAVWFPDGLRTFGGVTIAGIVTCAIVFFAVEISCRKIWPYFFPDGGLMKTPGVFRLRLQNRMLIIFGLASLLPIILMAVLSYNKAKMMLVLEPQEVIGSLLYLTAFLLAVVLATAIFFSRIFSTSIIAPVSQLETAMVKVEAGDFKALVPVESNDELGALAEHFNQMTVGLQERYHLRRSLDLAKEVQQNLLPKTDPEVAGLDIAGKSIYCDETGGDYFDYIDSSELGEQKFGVLVGDVSGHGIPSALLMATARAFLRQRSARSGSIAEVVSDVNRQLARDVEETGRFMTLFYLLIDQARRNLQWVRAGHDPALCYDPATDRFDELRGSGIALGVDDGWQYIAYEKSGLKKGQIILLSTDGIWETRNPAGNMFGKDPIHKIIRQKSDATASEIVAAIIAELEHFRQHVQPADDITLVVIRIEDRINQ
jgi:sigma-B regulation protein RsbU (phosphoserine phosphatase)